MNERTAELREKRYRAQAQAVQAIEDNLSEETVAAAMATAADLRAIHEPIYVQANSDRHGLRLSVSLDHSVSILHEERVREEELSMQIFFPSKGHMKVPISMPPGMMAPRIYSWERSVAPAQYIESLVEELQRHNRYEPGMLDGEVFFSNLKKTLDIAIRRRRRDDPSAPQFQGRLIEIYDDEWFLTDVGIECPSRGFLRPNDETLRDDLPPPSFVAEDEWRFLVALAIGILEPPHKGGRSRVRPTGLGSSPA